MDANAKWIEKNGTLFPKIKKAGAAAISYKLAGDLLFVGGTAPRDKDGRLVSGRVGGELTTEEGYMAARLAGLAVLTYVKDALGSLDKVEYCVKATVLVNSAPDFSEIEKVADGFSDALTEVLGERGKHVRYATGASALERNAAAICDLIVKVRD